MSATVKYKGNTIASITTTSSKTLKTNGKYCEGDIIVENVQDGGITPSGTIDITENGTFDVTAFASALVNVEGGGSEWSLEILDEGELTFLENTNVFTIDFSVENPKYVGLIIRSNSHIPGCIDIIYSTLSRSGMVHSVAATDSQGTGYNNLAINNAFTISATPDSVTYDGTDKALQRYMRGNYSWSIFNVW